MLNLTSHLVSAFRAYRRLDSHILNFILAEFFLHLVSACFFLVLNLYMRAEGYADESIGGYLAGRHLTIMLLAYPVGMIIRRRPLLPWLRFSAITFPLLSFGLVLAVSQHEDFWLRVLFVFWGASFFSVRAIAAPYILRNCNPELHAEALALNFSSWSVGMIMAGLANWGLASINPHVFNECTLLLGFAVVGFTSLIFVQRVGVDTYDPDSPAPKGSDWWHIAKALSPVALIAIGAGLTIQFMNLYFNAVFGVEYDLFSLMGAATSILATMAVLLVPAIKLRFGYEGSITATQSLAWIALVGLATMEYFAGFSWALGLAVFFYAVRQPLMNMANPMTTELLMYYVGDSNREITSAMTGAIWSGSWFFSSLIFSILRAQEVPYAQIFYITAALYAAGIYGFYLLIGAFRKKTAAESSANQLQVDGH